MLPAEELAALQNVEEVSPAQRHSEFAEDYQITTVQKEFEAASEEEEDLAVD